VSTCGDGQLQSRRVRHQTRVDGILAVEVLVSAQVDTQTKISEGGGANLFLAVAAACLESGVDGSAEPADVGRPVAVWNVAQVPSILQAQSGPDEILVVVEIGAVVV
jgi:hypothetical protein